MPDRRHDVARGLADAFLAGPWERASLTGRGQRAVGERRVWVRDIAVAVVDRYPVAPSDRPRQLARAVAALPQLAARLAEGDRPPPTVVRHHLPRTAMGPTPWPVPALDTVADLQDLLGLPLTRLLWLADNRHLERGAPDRARNYRYRWVPKRSGGARLLEEPKPQLKHVQRVLLREILGVVPPHDAVHGFRPGRSARTYAAAHTGRAVVVHLDLRDFFGSIGAGPVFALFRRFGYPEPVAWLLAGLVTNTAPSGVVAQGGEGADGAAARSRLRHPHLPQGAPTSPAVANLVADRLDRRLHGLARATGFVYTRYADDLALSSATPAGGASCRRLVEAVGRIAADEGFALHPDKASVRRRGQRQELAGIVVNAHPALRREDYDRLRAVLHNAARRGPAVENRDGHPDLRAHLLGRIAWVSHLDPARGARLAAAFGRIDWADPPSGSIS